MGQLSTAKINITANNFEQTAESKQAAKSKQTVKSKQTKGIQIAENVPALDTLLLNLAVGWDNCPNPLPKFT